MSRFKTNFPGNADLPVKFNIYLRISIMLIAAAVVLLLAALATDRNDFTTAMLIAVSLVNFMTGIIMITFTRSGGIHPGLSAMLYPPLIIDKTGIFSGLNVYGDAHFIPKSITGQDKALQFNPTGEYSGFNYQDSYFSTNTEDTAGIFTDPSSSSLLNSIVEDYSLKIPFRDETKDQIAGILKEVFTEITCFCENLEISESGEDFIVKMMNPALMKGCNKIRNESPKCCTVSPCPVCSLACQIITEYFNKVTVISTIKTDQDRKEIIIILRILSQKPKDEDRGSLNLFSPSPIPRAPE